MRVNSTVPKSNWSISYDHVSVRFRKTFCLFPGKKLAAYRQHIDGHTTKDTPQQPSSELDARTPVHHPGKFVGDAEMRRQKKGQQVREHCQGKGQAPHRCERGKRGEQVWRQRGEDMTPCIYNSDEDMDVEAAELGV